MDNLILNQDCILQLNVTVGTSVTQGWAMGSAQFPFSDKRNTWMGNKNNGVFWLFPTHHAVQWIGHALRSAASLSGIQIEAL